MKVFRSTERPSKEELLEISYVLRGIYRQSQRLLNKLNGRVLVRWLDPLCSGGRALRYFEELRSALDDDESWLFDSIDLFYGWHARCSGKKFNRECGALADWLVWKELDDGTINYLELQCRSCHHDFAASSSQVGVRDRSLDIFFKMLIPEFVDWSSSYRWTKEQYVKLLQLWTTGSF